MHYPTNYAQATVLILRICHHLGRRPRRVQIHDDLVLVSTRGGIAMEYAGVRILRFLPRGPVELSVVGLAAEKLPRAAQYLGECLPRGCSLQVPGRRFLAGAAPA